MNDDWAEYSDADFLGLLGLHDHATALREFWPRRGPQWDALGLAGGVPVLVEAKAHIKEFLSPETQAGSKSRAHIVAAFQKVQADAGLAPRSDWARCFYQLANRLAHLWFLQSRGVPAVLMLVGFVGDRDICGPHHPEAWNAAEEVAFFALGVPASHPLRRAVISVHPDVRQLV